MCNISLLTYFWNHWLLGKYNKIQKRDKITRKPHKSHDLQTPKYAVCFPHLFSVQLLAGQAMPPTKAEVKECRNRITEVLCCLDVAATLFSIFLAYSWGQRRKHQSWYLHPTASGFVQMKHLETQKSLHWEAVWEMILNLQTRPY